MNTRTRVAAVAAALATAVGGTALLPTQVDAVGRIPIIKTTVTHKAIRLSMHSVQAGRVRFRVVTPAGDHVLQLVRLHKGYTKAQFGQDMGKAFSGDTAAIKRVDRRVTWAGGAEAKPNKGGAFATVLTAGTYYLIDQNDQTGRVVSALTVTGPLEARAPMRTSSTIVGTGADRFRAPLAIPHTGWTVFKDTSDEPHFLVFQRVKPNVTRKTITQYFQSGSQAEPPWILPGSTSTGVISGGSRTVFHYNLPAGHYALLCWWPSDETGMPHAMMGMYRLINLR